MDEEFKAIPGFSWYLVGNRGTVVSIRWGDRRIVAISTNRKGYKHANVQSSITKKRHTLGVHRLVLLAFVGPCPEEMEACHNDGNPKNNMLENLRWDTRVNNHADKHKHGTSLEGRRRSKRAIGIHTAYVNSTRKILVCKGE